MRTNFVLIKKNGSKMSSHDTGRSRKERIGLMWLFMSIIEEGLPLRESIDK